MVELNPMKWFQNPVGAAGDAAAKAVTEKDPEYMDNLINLLAARTGIPPEKLKAILNQAQGTNQAIEGTSKYLRGDAGVDATRNQVSQWDDLIKKNTELRGDQSKKAAEELVRLLDTLNAKNLEVAGAKSTAQISSYEKAGNMGAMLYGIGVFVDAFSPTWGAKLKTAGLNAMEAMNEKIRGTEMAVQDQSEVIRGFETTMVRMAGLGLVKTEEAAKIIAQVNGTRLKDGTITPESLAELRDRAYKNGLGNPDTPLKTVPEAPTTTPFPVGSPSGAKGPAPAAAGVPAAKSTLTPDEIDKGIAFELNKIKGNIKLSDQQVAQLAAGYALADKNLNARLDVIEAAEFRKGAVFSKLDPQSKEAISKALGLPPAIAPVGAAPRSSDPNPKAISAGLAGNATDLQMALERIGLNTKQAASITAEAFAADKAVGSNGKLLDSQAEIDKLHKSTAYKVLAPDMQKAIDDNFKAPAPAPQ